jgi:hypothetical protein
VTTDVVALLDEWAAHRLAIILVPLCCCLNCKKNAEYAVQVTTDVVALLDEWAARFFDELDYIKEGQNATLFTQQMAADLPQVRC